MLIAIDNVYDFSWILSFLIDNLLPAILIFFIGCFLADKLLLFIKNALTKTHVDETVITFFNSILKVIFRFVVILIALRRLGIDISSLVSILAAALVTVGLALKDSLANLASGTIIILSKPFKIGDMLETSEISGIVTKIEMLFTTVRTEDNKDIVIPNSSLTSNFIVNGSINDLRRLDILIPIKNSTNFTEVKNLIDDIISKTDNILSEPSSPKITLDSFGEGVIKVSLKVWCKTKDYNKLKEVLLEKIKGEFEKYGIDY